MDRYPDNVLFRYSFGVNQPGQSYPYVERISGTLPLRQKNFPAGVQQSCLGLNDLEWIILSSQRRPVGHLFDRFCKEKGIF